MLLSSRSFRVAFWLAWDANTDACSAHRPRDNRNCSVHEPDSLLHARKAQTSTLPRRVNVKALTCIADRETNFIQVLRQLHIHSLDPTMLHCIVEGFLQDSEECQAGFEGIGAAASVLKLISIP